MTEQQTVQRAQEAQRLLDSPLLLEIWDGIEKEATEALLACSMKPGAREERDALIWHLKMVQKQKSALLGMIEQGKFAQYKIETAKNPSLKAMFKHFVSV